MIFFIDKEQERKKCMGHNCKKLFQFLNDDFFSANYNRKELKQFAITEPKKVLRSTSKFSINPFINSFKE